MTSRVAVLSDIHGMLPALERVLADESVISAELIVVIGDHLWGPQPTQVLDRLIDLGDRAVLLRGNADREALQIARGVLAGVPNDPVSTWGAHQLTDAHRELLSRMPETVTVEIDGFGPVVFCHATPRSDDEVVLVDSGAAEWADALESVPADIRTVVCGHTHMPFTRLVGGRMLVNPGSVGLPYGRSGAHWAVLDSGAVTLGRTPVDTDQLVREVAERSQMPNVAEWLNEMVRSPADDLDALAFFRSRRSG